MNAIEETTTVRKLTINPDTIPTYWTGYIGYQDRPTCRSFRADTLPWAIAQIVENATYSMRNGEIPTLRTLERVCSSCNGEGTTVVKRTARNPYGKRVACKTCRGIGTFERHEFSQDAAVPLKPSDAVVVYDADAVLPSQDERTVWHVTNHDHTYWYPNEARARRYWEHVKNGRRFGDATFLGAWTLSVGGETIETLV